MKAHQYNATVEWTGNTGSGTSHYRTYQRNHSIHVEGKPELLGSSDPVFRGDKTRYNPEDLLVVSLSACHLLSYLHACADAGVIITAYTDNATGTMEETPDGGGRFTEVQLHPVVTVQDASMVEKANQLHDVAHHRCFIASSCNFPVRHFPTCKVQEQQLHES